METRFRLATISDIPAVVELVQQFYKIFGYPASPEKLQEALQALVHQPRDGQVWLIIASDQIAGYAILNFGFSLELYGRYVFIDELFVTQSQRGSGIGTSFLEFIEEHARQEGFKALFLEVEPENTRAYTLYEQKGFLKSKRTVMKKRLHETTT